MIGNRFNHGYNDEYKVDSWLKTNVHNPTHKIIGIFFLFVVLFPFQNCTLNTPVQFTDNSRISLLTIKGEGNGEGYSGKPDVGDYVRSFPGYICQNDSPGLQGTAEVNLSELVIQKDNCQIVDYTLPLLDSRISSSWFNREYFTLGTSVYERVSSENSNLPVTEAFCRFQSNTEAMEVALKVDNSFTNSSAKIYLGNTNSINGAWQSQRVPEFKVLRTLNTNHTSYSGPGFSIEIQHPKTVYSLSSGYVVTQVDGQTYTYVMDCRTAYTQPVDLNEIWELNSSWMNLTGLVGYWKFNELLSGDSSPVLDSSNLNSSGQLHTDEPLGVIKTLTNNLVRSLNLNGNDRIFIFSQPAQDPTNNISVGIWLNRSSYGDAPFIGHTDGGGYYLKERALAGGARSIGFTIFINNIEYHVGIPPTDLVLGQWFHLVGTYDGTSIRLYINGVEIASQVISGPITYGTSMPLCIGAQSQPVYSCGAPFALGMLDDAFIFNRALSADEIQRIYLRQSKTP